MLRYPADPGPPTLGATSPDRRLRGAREGDRPAPLIGGDDAR